MQILQLMLHITEVNVRIKTNEENTEITDIVMKKMSENHVETCEW